MDLLQWLHRKLAEAGDSMKLSIKELGLVQSGKSVFAVTLGTSVVEVWHFRKYTFTRAAIKIYADINACVEVKLALRRGLSHALMCVCLLQVYRFLAAKDVAACAVVDEQGHLTGNISVSDLKYSLFEDLQKLDMTVAAFLQSRTAQHFPIYVHEDATLAEVITQLALSKVHRVYVCSPQRLMRGIITLTDVIAIVSKLSTKPEGGGKVTPLYYPAPPPAENVQK